ncbi:MAG: GNAT family N-acetyltransferase [Bacteroidetes bacterium]|nr:GNAT family N-acetyltransferase [Bacteroidota bacterium]
MIIQEIPFASPQFDEVIQLRTRILRDPLGLEFHAKDLAEEWNSIHLACYDNDWQLLGCLVLKPLSETNVKMRQVAVDDMRQNKGVGTALVYASEEVARNRGFKVMELHAREPAIPFYKRLQYKKTGRKFKEVGIPHYRMEKNL